MTAVLHDDLPCCGRRAYLYQEDRQEGREVTRICEYHGPQHGRIIRSERYGCLVLKWDQTTEGEQPL